MTTPSVRDLQVVNTYEWLLVEADGLVWAIEDKTGNDTLTLNHEQDPPGRSVHDYICSHFAPGLLFLDVGAHEGHYALRAAAAGCQVIAVEANPETAGILRFNRDLNQLQCQIWAFAAWDTTMPVRISVPKQGKLRNGSASVADPDSDGSTAYERLSITVMGRPLDAMQWPDHVGLVKLDVEGADEQVIEGMMGMLIRDRPVIIHETHEQYETYEPEAMQALYDWLSAKARYEWTDIRSLGVETPYKYMVGIADDSRGSDSS